MATWGPLPPLMRPGAALTHSQLGLSGIRILIAIHPCLHKAELVDDGLVDQFPVRALTVQVVERVADKIDSCIVLFLFGPVLNRLRLIRSQVGSCLSKTFSLWFCLR